MKESGLRDILRSLFGRTAMVVATVAIVGSGSIKAHAETQLMPDGNYFDPEYYAQTNPDVVASFGTDPNSLYYHYCLFGKNRLECNLSTSFLSLTDYFKVITYISLFISLLIYLAFT